MTHAQHQPVLRHNLLAAGWLCRGGLPDQLRCGRGLGASVQVLVRIIRDFARSPSAPMRLVFPHVAAAALSTFSASFFSQHLLRALLALCADRVADVRVAAAPLLPAAKRTIRLPDGVADLEAVNSAAASLLSDPDRRVSAAARAMSARLKALPVRLASVGVLDMHGASARPESGSAPLARNQHTASHSHMDSTDESRHALTMSKPSHGVGSVSLSNVSVPFD